MIRVMVKAEDEDPITLFVQVDDDELEGKVDGKIYDEVDEDLIGSVTYEIECPQCKTITKIIGEMNNKVFSMKEPQFKCPDCHIEIPLMIKKYK